MRSRTGCSAAPIWPKRPRSRRSSARGRRRIGSIPIEIPVRGWRPIAKRSALDIHRREARRPANRLDDVAADHPSVVSSPPDLATLDAVWQVRQAIEALPPDEATVVRLQHLHGSTHTEIAAKLGIAVGTVKSRSHRAHTKLAVMLAHLREVT
jgi:DNA-directed RNA polymerase specialized sigma24 family protein